MASLHIVVVGKPVSWKRAARNSKTGAVYVDRDSENYRAIIREAARPHVEGRALLTGPVLLSLVAVFAIPKGWPKYRKARALEQTEYKTGGIDLDNLMKAAKDSLKSVVYGDDSQVVAYGYCAKIYGERPRLEITITPIELAVALPVAASRPATSAQDLFAGVA
jgi:Holliday junction resolvase RusA-like endonuclease